MEFEIEYFIDHLRKKPVEEFLFSLEGTNPDLLAKAFNVIGKIRSRVYHKEPFSKYIESNLWELRIKERNNILRIFYTFRKGKVIILLHVFIKKKQKTPLKELEIARKRLKELRIREVN